MVFVHCNDLQVRAPFLVMSRVRPQSPRPGPDPRCGGSGGVPGATRHSTDSRKLSPGRGRSLVAPRRRLEATAIRQVPKLARPQGTGAEEQAIRRTPDGGSVLVQRRAGWKPVHRLKGGPNRVSSLPEGDRGRVSAPGGAAAMGSFLAPRSEEPATRCNPDPGSECAVRSHADESTLTTATRLLSKASNVRDGSAF